MRIYPPAPKIAAPAREDQRPFWSVMIPTYNREAYIEKTLAGVLSQAPGPEEMQIEVVDDASTEGDIEALVQRIGNGRVGFFRQPRNLGIMANWNSCIERSVGQWVHILHSDDVVFSGFYTRLREAVRSRPDVGAAFCRYAQIDENDTQIGISELERETPGLLSDYVEKLGVSNRIQCPAMTVKRAVYEDLGGFRADLPYAGDWEMWIRIAVKYPFWYEPGTLAGFRVHSQSYTKTLLRSGRTTADERRCIEMVRPLLPADRVESVSRQARELAALRALQVASDRIIQGEWGGAFRQVWEGLRCSASLHVMQKLFESPLRLAKWGTRWALRAVRKQFAPE